VRFSPTSDGRFAPNLEPHERQFLAALPEQLQDLLDRDDPSLRRLFPTAYHQDAERDAEFQRLMREDLLTRRKETAQLLAGTAQSETLSAEELGIWMNAINDLRLVLGTQLDVSEGMDVDDLAEDDPRMAQFAVYGWLSMLLEQIIRALSEG
jgi:Domain of unknown function (DUF2017)